MTRFSDTPEGALACLNAEAGWDLKIDDVAARADDYVEGCWLLRTHRGAFLVYVAGHEAAPGIEEVES